MTGVRALWDGLWRGLQATFGDRVILNGHPEDRLPNTLNVSFVGKVGADMLGQLNGVAASTGSACHSRKIELSPVLAAMGVPERIGMGAVRFSFAVRRKERTLDPHLEGAASVRHAHAFVIDDRHRRWPLET